jgi:uncharacterized protein YecT (DUF1311 family)
MRTIKLTLLGLAFSLPALALAVPPTPDELALREACSGGASVEMQVCLEKKVKDSQKALKQAEKRAVAAISKWDEDKRYINLAKAKLATSNKEFIKHRYAHCEFMTSLSGGGIHHDFRRLACVAELNYRRAKQLRDVVADFDWRAEQLRESGSTLNLRAKEEPSDTPSRSLTRSEPNTPFRVGTLCVGHAVCGSTQCGQ